MSTPACYVVGAAEWAAFLDALVLLVFLPPVIWLALRVDLWRMADRWRVHRRRARISRIRRNRYHARNHFLR